MYEPNQTEPTRVGVSLGYKLNMGNYENLDLGFSISDSARPGEPVQVAFDRVYAFVEKQLTDKINEARG